MMEKDGRFSFRLHTLRSLRASEEECPVSAFPFGLKYLMAARHLIYDEPVNDLNQGKGGFLLNIIYGAGSKGHLIKKTEKEKPGKEEHPGQRGGLEVAGRRKGYITLRCFRVL